MDGQVQVWKGEAPKAVVTGIRRCWPSRLAPYEEKLGGWNWPEDLEVLLPAVFLQVS